MHDSQFTKRRSQLRQLAAWGALVFGGGVSFGLVANATEEPAQQSEPKPAAAAVASIDGAEIFAREWIPGDKRSHGGDGLGPVFNDSSCVACHNQGGVGGAGPASKNVDIVTAFHAPQQNQQRHNGNSINVPRTLPGIVFQSVFGNLDSLPPEPVPATEPDQQTAPEGEVKEQLTAAEQAAAQRKIQEEAKKKQVEADRQLLAKLHPGFGFANSVVLHKDATFAGYELWRNKIAGMQFGFQTQQAEVQLFNAQVAVAQVNDRTRRVNGNMLMQQLKQQVQMASRRGMSSSTRQGNFVITKSQRNTTALFGAGLIDSIPTEVLEALEQAQTKNKVISGRVARLKDGSPGRFGWKSQKSRLSDFVLTACAVEVGLDVPNHPQAGHPQKADYRPAGLDLNQEQCDALIDYIGALPAPAQRKFGDETDRGYIKGGHALFAKVGCADCHVENVGEVAGIFSDVLLHDMGGELGDTGSYDVFIPDSTPEGDVLQLTGLQGPASRIPKKITGATRQEWRTAPLWGVRDSAPYLHDGRAQTLAQAIAMHGGESTSSTQKFFALSDAERFQVISFLKSLVAPGQEVAFAR